MTRQGNIFISKYGRTSQEITADLNRYGEHKIYKANEKNTAEIFRNWPNGKCLPPMLLDRAEDKVEYMKVERGISL